MLRNIPIRRKLMVTMLLVSGAVLLLTCTTFVTHEFLTFRQTLLQNIGTLARVIAANSSAALAFDNQEDAAEILGALRAEPHVIAAGLYKNDGTLFASYPASLPAKKLPTSPERDGYYFEHGALIGVERVREGDRRWGTLYVKSDLGALYERLQLYSGLAGAVLVVSFLVAIALSRILQRQISRPILALAETAQAVSDRRDYSVRAPQLGRDEFGALTNAFNHMLTQIQEQDRKARAHLARLDLLQRITRAIGERQDLASIFRVVIQNLEDNLPIDLGFIGLHEPTEQALTVSQIGERSGVLAAQVGITEQSRIFVEENGLARCLKGQLIYEPNIEASTLPLWRRLAGSGLRAMVVTPLLGESRVYGVLVAARHAAASFSSNDCEFLRQLSEHVALAAHQAQLNHSLQQAYEDLRRSQQTILQQERLRALGQMASGVAHDINNAISPVALYTESLLENEPGLSDRARGYLSTIQRAIEDVAQTVSRMREFYRPRESELPLWRVDLNVVVQQVVELTRVRWRDVPQQRGAVIDLRTELRQPMPSILGSESEIRDALTNLIFNAVDAMPDGGLLTICTRVATHSQGEGQTQVALLEVCDSGLGMDEVTQQHCLEPFFTTKGERGTGLGLAMVYGMAQRHNAELQIESAPGHGTTMRLVFRTAPIIADVPGCAFVPKPALRSLRILIVDDDPLIIESVRATLESDGHQVTTADGGAKGIEMINAAQHRGEKFSVVITDLGMPYVDGRRVAAAVKAAAPSTPVILLTGWGQRMIDDNDVPAYVDRVISKPPKLSELRSALADLVGDASA
jgi:signal transduction histidine kinase/ActR/RegA family two-component response regulator/HAMP domain-containing protein